MFVVECWLKCLFSSHGFLSGEENTKDAIFAISRLFVLTSMFFSSNDFCLQDGMVRKASVQGVKCFYFRRLFLWLYIAEVSTFGYALVGGDT
jgi:hypothetical protein